MFVILEQLERIRDDSLTYGKILAEQYPDAKDPRSGCFFTIHNKATLALEVLSMYAAPWKVGPGTASSDLEDEWVDRIMEITKHLFVETMSSIEFFAVRIASMVPEDPMGSAVERFRGERGHVNLRDLVLVGSEIGLMTSLKEREWHDMITVRNLVVHNSSVADRSQRCVVGKAKVSMRPNRMMKGAVNTFVELSEQAMNNFYEWMSRLDTKRRLGT